MLKITTADGSQVRLKGIKLSKEPKETGDSLSYGPLFNPPISRIWSCREASTVPVFRVTEVGT